MTGSTDGYQPHPHIGGRIAALRALASWRMEWPGSPRVVVVTGDAGSGRSRLITGFLMLCDAGFREQLPLEQMDPSTVPPELPAPAVPNVEGLSAAQVLWLLADHFKVSATSTADVHQELASLDRNLTVVVPDVDRAGPIRAADEPARLVREVLKPLAALETIRLLVDVPRPLAIELAEGLPAGVVQVIDLNAHEWADPDGLVLQAEAALNPRFGAPELPFTADPESRWNLARAVAGAAGSNPLIVQLAAHSVLMAPGGFDPSSDRHLPSSIGEALDMHAERLGADPRVLRLILAPLALAEQSGLPFALWAPLAGAIAGRDMGADISRGAVLAGPFVQPAEVDEVGTPTMMRLLHPAIGDEIRTALPNIRSAQARVSTALLEAVPEQDWSKADPYVRNYLAGHTLEAGLLPQLLTDPGLFVYADPVLLRAAVESVPVEELGAPARTYLRIAPLLTRTKAPAVSRAALLETAFVEDGLPQYATAVHQLSGLDLPWRTLWSVRIPGISAVTVGHHSVPEGPSAPVGIIVVPFGTPGAQTLTEGETPSGENRSAILVRRLDLPEQLNEINFEHIRRPTAEQRAAAPLALSRGADYLRVWDRAEEEVVAALASDTPFIDVDLSEDGILLVATERGAKALRIRSKAPQIAS